MMTSLDKSVTCSVELEVLINRGKVAFVDSGTVLRYCIGSTFLATFRSDLDLLQAIQQLEH